MTAETLAGVAGIILSLAFSNVLGQNTKFTRLGGEQKRLIMAGLVGHSLGVLMDRYAHFIPTMQDEAAALMDQLTFPQIIYKP